MPIWQSCVLRCLHGQNALRILLLAILYAVSGQISFSIAVSSGIVSPVVFAAEGFSLAAVIVWGPAVWPGVFLGQLGLALFNGLSWPLAVGVSVSNSLEAVMGVLLFRYFRLSAALATMRDLIGLLLLVTCVLQPLSALVGTTILWAGGMIEPVGLASALFSWWLGNSLGQILIVPLLLALAAQPQFVRSLRCVLSVIPIAIASSIIFYFVPSSGMAIAFAAAMPALIILAVNWGLAAVSVAVVTLSCVTLYYTHLGLGPFVNQNQTLVIDLNIFLLGIALTGQWIAILFAERKAAEIAIRDSESKFHTLYESTSDSVMLFDSRACFDCNHATLEMFGCTSHAQFFSQTIRALFPPVQSTDLDSIVLIKQFWRAALRSGRQQFECQMRRIDSGAIFDVECVLSPVMLNHRRVIQATVRDITERKRVERMKNEFVSTVSHELRTPLTSISSGLALVNSGMLGELPEKSAKIIEIAHKNSLRLTALINDLLDMEKLLAGKLVFRRQAHPIVDLVESALESVQAYADTYHVHLALSVQLARDTQVYVDALRLQQVLSNFLSNAAKFSPTGGQVEVVVRWREAWVRVEVIDHGMGIPEKFHGQIFQKFSQVDASDTRQKGGTGLGLAISKELIERMHGKIGFTSAEGMGACFYFELPDIVNTPF